MPFLRSAAFTHCSEEFARGVTSTRSNGFAMCKHLTGYGGAVRKDFLLLLKLIYVKTFFC